MSLIVLDNHIEYLFLVEKYSMCIVNTTKKQFQKGMKKYSICLSGSIMKGFTSKRRWVFAHKQGGVSFLCELGARDTVNQNQQFEYIIICISAVLCWVAEIQAEEKVRDYIHKQSYANLTNIF